MVWAHALSRSTVGAVRVSTPGEGNPLDDGVDDYPMHYMWDDILRRDSLIELITKFVFIQREQVVDELTGKKSVKEKLIFPALSSARCRPPAFGGCRVQRHTA